MVTEHKPETISDDLPEIPPGPKKMSDIGERYPESTEFVLGSKKLKDICNKWKQKRDEYPGWIVPPFDSRKKIWEYTEYWIDPILSSIDNLEMPDKFHLIYELVWRLIISMSPIFEDWIEKIKLIIDSINPFPKIIHDKAEYSPMKKKYSAFDWGKIANYWVEINFALIREFRLDKNKKIFDEIMNKIEKIIHKNINWRAKWFYEKSQLFLNQFDIDNVKVTLNNWPKQRGSPFWEVKRASILAEIGSLEEAEKIAEEALNDIRLEVEPYPNNFLRISQEGWTMLLLKCIKDNKLGIEKNYVGDFLNRWEYLNKYYCNPWAELKLLTSKIEGLQIKDKEVEKVRRGFDPEKFSISKHFETGFVFNDIMPAFAFLRIFEEGALPVSCGRIINFGDTLVKATKLTLDCYYFNSFNLILRTGRIKEIDKFLTRPYVVRISQDKFKFLSEEYFRVFKYFLTLIKSDPKSISNFFIYRSILVMSELISRFLIRFTDTQQEDLLGFAIEIYNFYIFRQIHDLHESVFNIFKRLLKAIPETILIKYLNKLLELPIPSEKGFKVSTPQFWPEPFNLLELDKELKETLKVEFKPPFSTVKYLINTIRKGEPEARKRALSRLCYLYDFDVLSRRQIDLFADALWSRTNIKKELPTDTFFLDYSFLNLPGAKKNNVKQKLRRYFMNNDFPRLIKPIDNIGTKNGKPVPGISISQGGDNTIIQNIILSNYNKYNKKQKDNRKLINWNSKEASVFLKRSLDWWDSEKKYLSNDMEEFFSVKGVLRKEFKSLIMLLNKVILLRINKRNRSDKVKIIRLVKELEEKKFSILSTLPLLLLTDNLKIDDVAPRLLNGLNSFNSDEVRESIYGIFYWIALQQDRKIVKIPMEIKDDFINKVKYRRQPGLNIAIIHLINIIKIYPNELNQKHINNILFALEYLIAETELPFFEFTSVKRNIEDPIEIDDRHIYRRNSAELAYNLYRYLKRQNKEVPSILIKWEKTCQKDLLPEVKKVWQKNNL